MPSRVSDGRRPISKLASYLSASAPVTLVDTAAWYDVPGTFVGESSNRNFTVSASGLITFTGSVTIDFVFNGASDVEVSKACKLRYAIKVNGVVQDTITTPHDFTATSKVENISTTRGVTLAPGTTLQIVANSDVANTIMEAYTLFLTIWGEK